jgi:glycosyltransferase involved in cell wall biosynthesis
MARINVHIYPSPFKNESRILKITKTLVNSGIFEKIYILATWENGLPETELLDKTREVNRFPRRSTKTSYGTLWQVVATLEWSWRLNKFLKQKKIDCINCHSLSALPLCAFLKWIKRAKLIYDTHEIETETAGSAGVRRLLSKLVERVFIRYADVVITVNESIAQWYRNEYGLKNVYTVRNVPYLRDEEASEKSMLKSKFGIDNNEILFIYQGAFSQGRGIGILLDVFAKVHHQKHIVFMGFGELESTIKDYQRTYSNIHFQEAVRPEELHRYTMGADVGIYAMENVCLNHFLSLPNKVFEYIMSGLPIIVSDFPEMKRVVDDSKCGWTVPVDTDSLFALVTNISRNDITEKRNNALHYRKTIGWHHEEVFLLHAYRTVCEGNQT